MKINEIFYSLQGEGSMSGAPTIFIRMTGCNLRCSYCDTTYAYTKGTCMSVDEILENIEKYPCNQVCLTGGEPLLQNEFLVLTQSLLDKQYSVCVETNGSCSIEKLASFQDVQISLDLKLPSSKMHEKMDYQNFGYLRRHDQLKCVISGREDYECAKNILTEQNVPCLVFFQPVWGTNIQVLASWILEDGLPVRLGLQLHKVLWGDKKGR